MTKESLESIKYEADCEYAFKKRLSDRDIDDKYQRLMRLGFYTAKQRIAYVAKLEIAKETEKERQAIILRGDIEAKYFGMRGKQEIEKIFMSRIKILEFPSEKSA